VTYFLGGRSEKIQEHIDGLAEKDGIRVINLELEFSDDILIADESVFETDPAEFVWLIHHAEYVLTDSFHACTFSLIFEKPFIVFPRVIEQGNIDMGSRIDTLLGKLGLDDCRGDLKASIQVPQALDYSSINKELKEERERAIRFLVNALEE